MGHRHTNVHDDVLAQFVLQQRRHNLPAVRLCVALKKVISATVASMDEIIAQERERMINVPEEGDVSVTRFSYFQLLYW